MAIKQNPKSRRASKDAEAAAVSFIDHQDDAPAPTNGAGKHTVVMKMNADLVRRIDAAAASMGVSRTAWCSMKLAEALDR